MVGEGGGEVVELGGCAGEGGEIDVGGDVDFAGGFEWVFGGAVFGESAEGSGSTIGIVVFRGGEAVVEEEQEAVGEGGGDVAEEGEEAGADFCLVVFREVI